VGGYTRNEGARGRHGRTSRVSVQGEGEEGEAVPKRTSELNQAQSDIFN
jgi:hypothetical protein